MSKITAYHERLAKEYVFGFLRSHSMPFPVLVDIAVVPVKPGAILQWIHSCHKKLVYDYRIQVGRPELVSEFALLTQP